MITTTGLNQFNGMFSFLEWSAPIYETPEEVIEAFGKMNFRKRKVKSISVIGEGTAIGGTSFHPDSNQLFPCSADFQEPLQLIFEDGSTFEFLPMARGGARFAMNTIPAGMTTGVNNSNCDAAVLFGQEITGSTLNYPPIHIKNQSTIDYTACILSNQSLCASKHEETIWHYELLFENGYRLCISSGGDRRIRNQTLYNLSLQNSGRIVEIPSFRIEAAKNKRVQISFSNSPGVGGSMMIVPCLAQGVDKTMSWSSKTGNYPNYYLSVDDSLCRTFLSQMLYKHFNPRIQRRRDSWDDSLPTFDWYGVNIYTMASMRSFIASLNRTAILLEQDYNNADLEAIKERYCPSDFGCNTRLSPEERVVFIHQHIHIAVDFYQRFAHQLSVLLEEAYREGCDWVEVVGP